MLVILETPYFVKGNKDMTKVHVEYAKLCLADSLKNYNEKPLASHLLYTQELFNGDKILDDNNKWERDFGIEAGLLWGKMAQKTVVYIDFGISSGMKTGIERATDESREVEYRKLPEDLLKQFNNKYSKIIRKHRSA